MKPKTSTFAFAIPLLAAFALGCSAAAPPDPTSVESLHKAPPMAFGTTCTKVEDSSYGTSSSHEETPVCLEGGGNCGALKSSSGSDFGGGAAYNGFTGYKDVKWFEGTCADQKPITCDQRPVKNDCDACQYAKCCDRVALCEDDPNCVAIVDCVSGCKKDEACANRCLDHGDLLAKLNVQAAITCMVDHCTAECGY